MRFPFNGKGPHQRGRDIMIFILRAVAYEGSIPIMVKIPCLFFQLKNECPIVGILHSRTVICSCDIHHTCDKSISLCGTGIVVPFLAVTKF